MSGDYPGLSEVTEDGNPVAVYLALPAGDEPQLIHDAVGRGASILELGCGAGRVTRPLAALGHPMVAVDNSPAMLEHVTVAETVCADITALDLGRAFDAVLAASHLVNNGDRSWARALLATGRRHVSNDGVVLVERWNPEWLASVTVHRYCELSPVSATFRVIDRRGREFDGEVTYRLGERSWKTGPFTAAVVDDEDLAQYAAACDLVLDTWLDDLRTWALLRPADGTTAGRTTL
jgi:SAM-dependent methyltransferase